MWESFLEFLKCPKTGEHLELRASERVRNRVVSGELVSSGATYQIVRGIPRFIDGEQNYASSFGYQWHRWGNIQFESNNVGRPMAGHTREMFDRIVAQPHANLSSGVYADVGCGSGRFIEVLRSKGHSKVIGVDYSSAVEVAADHFRDDQNVLVVQADALNLPIRRQSMDGVYSIGTLHHTPEPRKGFREMASVVRPGGWIALCVYGRGGFYDDPRIVAYRRLFRLLRPMCGNWPPLLYSHMTAKIIYPFTRFVGIGALVRLCFPMARLPDVRWRVLDTFDAVTPAYQSTHESYEVFRWFRDEGLIDIEPSDWGHAAYHGRVAASDIEEQRGLGDV